MKHRRISAALCAICMVTAIFASCGQNAQDPEKNTTGQAFLSGKDLKISIPSHASWPYDEDWKVWEYIKQNSGLKLEIQAIPESDYPSKVSLMLASPDALPDMIYTTVKTITDQHATSGAFISLDENRDKLPDMYRYLDTLPEKERDETLLQRTSADGKIYSAPTFGTAWLNNIRTWMYRKDIFEKHNLEVPTTTDELYEVCKKLKKLYPESYPFSMRNGLSTIDGLTQLWAPYLCFNPYYDFTTETWRYGPREPEMKEVVEYFQKFYKEGLVAPDFLTAATKSWEEMMMTDRGFVAFDYSVRIDFFNKPAREENPDYTLAMMPPPKGTNEKGRQKMGKINIDLSGYMICNTGKQDRIDVAFKFLNWLYTEEACDLVSWGKEGETYVEENGKRHYTVENEELPQLKYGFATSGTFQRIYEEAYAASNTEEMVEASRKATQYQEDYASPLMWMPLSDEDSQRAADLQTALATYSEEAISKFMLNQKPMSEWDAFVKGLDTMGIDELLAIYDRTYEQLSGK